MTAYQTDVTVGMLLLWTVFELLAEQADNHVYDDDSGHPRMEESWMTGAPNADVDITILAPADTSASITLEEALKEVDAFYHELGITDEAAINGWDRETDARWMPATLVPIEFTDSRKFERDCDDWADAAEAAAQAKFEAQLYGPGPLVLEEYIPF